MSSRSKPHFTIVLWFLALSGCSVRNATPPSTPAKKIDGVHHVVQAGENLYRIGKAYDVPYGVLARINGIRDPAQIRVGQRIFIPGATRPLRVEVITPVEAPAVMPDAMAPHEAAQEGLLWPVSGVVNSPCGPRGASFHEGIDIAAPEGRPSFALERGGVVYSDESRGYGALF